MSLINIQNAYLSFSNLEILKNSTFYIKKHERICLIGKNGSGKSTVLKIINQTQDLDSGKIFYKKNIKISYLEQKNPNNLHISVYDFISLGLKKINTKNKNDILLNREEINIKDHIRITKTIKIMQLKKNTLLSELSGGLLRKVMLGQVLIENSDVLLLDEPTNHLDIKTVKWLENVLNKFPGSILFISHDRNFIQNISTRIIDLDRGKLISWSGNYKNFIKLKKENNRIEKNKKKIFDKNLKKEEKWIKTGVKARSTRNEGRVKNLQKLREENDNYNQIEKLGQIKINEYQDYSGKIFFKLQNINFSINNKIIIKNFSSTIQYGDKIGLIGDNGCGKTTIIKILIGEKKPQDGKIYKNKKIKISYFDQNRSFLDPNKSIIENMNYGAKEHIIKHLNAFLFKPNELTSLVKTLSGGQCNKLLLAQLFLRPSNVLILDEPTNDLDLDSIALLEKIIIDYKGTVLIVSHDEKFIQNTINKHWKFGENGTIQTYIGSISSLTKEDNIYKKIKNKKNTFIKKNIQKKIKKDLDQIVSKIEETELYIQKLQKKINKTDFFQKKIEDRLPILKILTEKENELKKQLIHWESLEKSIIKYKN